MDTNPHTLSVLFAQLGLASDTASIKKFISAHELADDVPLADAPFWSTSQAAFLAEELGEDSEWAELVDELANLLTNRK